MASIDLYVDTYSGELVRGVSSSSVIPVPRFTQGDTVSFRVFLLARTDTYPTSTPYTKVLTTGLSLKMALGPKTGAAGSTLYTQQYTWTSAADNTYFYADFPLNTSGISTLLGSGETATAWWEIEYTQNGYPTTVLQKSVTVHAEVIETASVTTPAGLTAMSAEEANATFLKKKIPGAIYFEDINNPGSYIAVFNENGELRAQAAGTIP